MRVSFRWSRGALATKLDRTPRRLRRPRARRARAPGSVERDGLRPRRPALERDQDHRHRAAAGRPAPPTAAGHAARGLQGQRHVDLGARRSPRAATSPRSPPAPAPPACRPCSSRAPTAPPTAGRSSPPSSSPALHANGLRACAWQFVYGNDPAGEAALGVDAIAAGADCLVIDAESRVRGQVRQPRSSTWRALRAAVGPAYPIGLHHLPLRRLPLARCPTRVFLGPGGAQANLPQVYWKDIGGTVDAVSAHTLAHNRIYGIADRPARPDLPATRRPRTSPASARLWAAYGSAGLSLVVVAGARPRPAGPRSTSRSRRSRSPRPIRAGPRWPRATRATRSCGCSSTSSPPIRPSSSTARSTPPRTRRCANFQAVAGPRRSPATTDALTWQAVLALPLQPDVDNARK